MRSGNGIQRVAGGLVVALGVANVVLGLLSLLTLSVQLSVGTAGGLVVLGAVTAAAGVLVWRGSRLVTSVTLTVFGLLLVVQLGDALTTSAVAVDDPAGDPLLRVAVLAVVVTALALAAWRLRRGRGVDAGR